MTCLSRREAPVRSGRARRARGAGALAGLAAPAALAALAALWACAAHAEPARYTIDPTHTTVHFEWRPAGLATLRARLARAQGAVTLDREARTGSAEITIELGSLSTGSSALDERLRGADLLAAAEHPHARFVGERFRFGEGPQALPAAVDGTLELRGRARPVALRATAFRCYSNLLLGREVCGGDFESTIRPADWGVEPGADPIATSQLRLLVQVEAIREEP